MPLVNVSTLQRRRPMTLATRLETVDYLTIVHHSGPSLDSEVLKSSRTIILTLCRLVLPRITLVRKAMYRERGLADAQDLSLASKDEAVSLARET
jgi:hypothetical protein